MDDATYVRRRRWSADEKRAVVAEAVSSGNVIATEKRHDIQAQPNWRGILQADAYGCYNRLYDPARKAGAVTSALWWGHARRCFIELADIAASARRGPGAAPISPIALEAVYRIDALFAIEREINGLNADKRLRLLWPDG